MTTDVALARVDTAHDVGLPDHRVQRDVDPPMRRLRGRPMFGVDGGTQALGRTVGASPRFTRERTRPSSSVVWPTAGALATRGTQVTTVASTLNSSRAPFSNVPRNDGSPSAIRRSSMNGRHRPLMNTGNVSANDPSHDAEIRRPRTRTSPYRVQADRLLHNGGDIAEACRGLGVSASTSYRLRPCAPANDLNVSRSRWIGSGRGGRLRERSVSSQE